MNCCGTPLMGLLAIIISINEIYRPHLAIRGIFLFRFEMANCSVLPSHSTKKKPNMYNKKYF